MTESGISTVCGKAFESSLQSLQHQFRLYQRYFWLSFLDRDCSNSAKKYTFFHLLARLDRSR